MLAVEGASYLYLDQARSTDFESCHEAGREEVAEQCNLSVMLERGAPSVHMSVWRCSTTRYAPIRVQSQGDILRMQVMT